MEPIVAPDTPSRIRPPRPRTTIFDADFLKPVPLPNDKENFASATGELLDAKKELGGNEENAIRTKRKASLNAAENITKMSRSSKLGSGETGSVGTKPGIVARPKPSLPASSQAAAAGRLRSNSAIPTRPSKLPIVHGSRPTQEPTCSSGTGDVEATLAAFNRKKRPAWDTKGRLEDMEQLTDLLKQRIARTNEDSGTAQQQLQKSKMRVLELEGLCQSLEARLVVKEDDGSSMVSEVSRLNRQLDEERTEYKTRLVRAESELQMTIESVSRDRDLLRAMLDQATRQLEDSKTECQSLKSALALQSSTMLDLECQARALRLKLEQSEGLVCDKSSTIASLQKQLSEAAQSISTMEKKLQDDETLRRKLHNTVQELKGNIRVFCRVRPPLPSENEKQEMTHLVIGKTTEDQDEIQMIQMTESASGNAISKSYPFGFDKVFGPSAAQEAVFDEISQLVQSALDGYRVSIFAYGQTGSGKTFTMEGGSRDNPEQAGMIPRAVAQIYHTAESMREKGWVFTFEASYLEIYNENIRDLLGETTADHAKHEIKHHAASGKTVVTDLTVVPVTSPPEVFTLLSQAARNRAVAETLCNDRSSRSHRLTGENGATLEKIEGLLNLIDLAGSERLSQSGSTGDRLRETQAINKSLSALGDVIASLANKETHIPYRNSKLTYLLQHSLGGNCKTLMFVNVSPSLSNFGETLCSLRFATKVNACQIGTARRTIK